MIVTHGIFKVKAPLVRFTEVKRKRETEDDINCLFSSSDILFDALDIDHEATVWEPVFLILPRTDENGKRRWFETAWRRYTNWDPLFAAWRHEEMVFGEKPANSRLPGYLDDKYMLAS
jgi:hypothetical protein